jgi:tetratricopeptide (TPR) repeat protein
VAFCQEDFFKKGSEEYILGNTENAMFYIYQAYQQNPQDEKIKKLLSQIYLEMSAKYVAEGNYVEASKYLEEAKKLKENLKKIEELEKAVGKLKKSSEEKKRLKKEVRKKKVVKKKEVKKKKPPVRKKRPVPEKKKEEEKIIKPHEFPEPILIEKEIIRERPVLDELKIIIVGVSAFFLLVIIATIIYIKIHLKQQRIETEEFLKEKEKHEKVLKSELLSLKTATQRLREQLEAERKKKFEAAKAMIEHKKETTDEKTYEKISKKIDELKVREAAPVRKRKVAIKPIPIESLLPEYTEIPTTTKELENLLKIASPAERGKIFWALGNKKDMRAVEILETYLEDAKGEDFREILKSLKKISMRPGIDIAIKNKIQEIFTKQRKKGIII